ncbi:MAG: methyltransferase domain-containing protein [Xanthomonadaceae bacterium]|nr:methyltransferase domain-containing protein [Xanthomonadaceae bacterium]
MTSHPRDILPHDLEAMASLTPYPQLLREIADKARRTIGFFPAHNPRALEYPWVLARLSGDLRGRWILDVGAGVNPLPFVLADRGARITTIDNHPVTRDPGAREQWNEWGFLDYGKFDPRIASLWAAYEDYDPAEGFDVIYSISVIEHLPAGVRRSWIGNFARQLTSGGMLLLTVDLVPGTNALWNRSEGQEVEPQQMHGEFATLLGELRKAGFEIGFTDIRRAIPDSRVDVGFVMGWKPNSVSASA